MFCMNRAIPWVRSSLRTAEPRAYLRALPSNLHSPSVLLIKGGRGQEGAVIAAGCCRFLFSFLPRDTSLSPSSPAFYSPFAFSTRSLLWFFFPPPRHVSHHLFSSRSSPSLPPPSCVHCPPPRHHEHMLSARSEKQRQRRVAEGQSK